MEDATLVSFLINAIHFRKLDTFLQVRVVRLLHGGAIIVLASSPSGNISISRLSSPVTQEEKVVCTIGLSRS